MLRICIFIMIVLALDSRALSIFSTLNAAKSHELPPEPWSHNMTTQHVDPYAPPHIGVRDRLSPYCRPSYDITDETSVASPLIADCEAMRDHINPNGLGAAKIQSTIVTWGTCAFGTEIDDYDADPKARTQVAQQDVVDAINGLLAKPRGDKVRMGGKGWMDCPDPRFFDFWWTVKWGVYHTK